MQQTRDRNRPKEAVIKGFICNCSIIDLPPAVCNDINAAIWREHKDQKKATKTVASVKLCMCVYLFADNVPTRLALQTLCYWQTSPSVALSTVPMTCLAGLPPVPSVTCMCTMQGPKHMSQPARCSCQIPSRLQAMTELTAETTSLSPELSPAADIIQATSQ